MNKLHENSLIKHISTLQEDFACELIFQFLLQFIGVDEMVVLMLRIPMHYFFVLLILISYPFLDLSPHLILQIVGNYNSLFLRSLIFHNINELLEFIGLLEIPSDNTCSWLIKS